MWYALSANLGTFFCANNIRSLSIDDVTEGIDDIANSIAEHGTDPVLIALFIVMFIVILGLFIALFKKNDKSKDNYANDDHNFTKNALDTLMQSMLEQNRSMMKQNEDSTHKIEMFMETISHKLDSLTAHNQKVDEENDYHKDIVGNFIDMNVRLRTVSQNALEALKCDRIAIYVFHNGNSSIHGLPFFKMSCIGEWNSNGKNSVRGKTEIDTPLQVFSDFIENLYKDGYFKAGDIKKAAETDPSVLEFTSYTRTEAMYIMPTKDVNGVLAGFVIAEFNEKKNFDDPEYDQEIRNVLGGMNNTIQPTITEFRNRKRIADGSN
ncbi:MAG: hypothetical protein NC489_42665 [Ruminococcus flavefaciens]|nr:hypothetical protein [Ruminococcus flavefaciens]